MNMNDQSNQLQERRGEDHSGPARYRLLVVNKSGDILAGVLETQEFYENDKLKGYQVLPDTAGAFIASYVKGPIPTKKLVEKVNEPELPDLQFTSDDIDFLINEKFTVSELEDQIIQRKRSMHFKNVKNDGTRKEIGEGVKDIYAELDPSLSPADKMVATSRQEIDAIVADEGHPSDSDFAKFMEDNSMENV